MVKVVGIRFRNAGKIYYFGPGKLQLKAGIHAIVETARGVEMGTVMTDPREVSEESVAQPLKPVIRIATEQDEKQAEKNRQKENNTTHGRRTIFLQMRLWSVISDRLSYFQFSQNRNNYRSGCRTDHEGNQNCQNNAYFRHNSHLFIHLFF